MTELRVCHTSDWHLGHSLHRRSRAVEHAAFFAFLADLLERERVDVLIVAGDVFDSANPPGSAQAQLFELLATLRRRMPALQIVIAAGNHDSPARLAAPEPVLRPIGVHVLGAMAWKDGELDPAAMIVPLRDARGEVAARAAVVPYLRASDLPAGVRVVGADAVSETGSVSEAVSVSESVSESESVSDSESDSVSESDSESESVSGSESVSATATASETETETESESESESATVCEAETETETESETASTGVEPARRLADASRRVFGAVASCARAQMGPGEALIVVAHQHFAGGRVSDGSERALIGGAAGALPTDVLPEADYVALGHLHLPQAVGAEHVRYSGSPIPLALGEETYPHEVRILRFEGGRLSGSEGHLVPRSVQILRVPRSGPAPLDEALEALRALALDEALPQERWPWLEVRVRLDSPDPTLRAQIDEVLEGRPLRLVKITVEHARADAARVSAEPIRELADLDPRDVFARRWVEATGEAPSEAISAAFEDALSRASEALGGGAP